LSHFAEISNLLESARKSLKNRYLRIAKSRGIHGILEYFFRI
jgi:hypothetical protein